MEQEKKKLVTILVPAYNEQEVLHLLYDRLEKLMNENTNYDFEVLLVNDGSKDKTFEIMQELREKDKRFCYLNLSRNFGKETAMIAGLDYCKGDAVVIIDADLQDPPELIPEMIKYWEEGYDDVYAKRKSREGETWLKKFTSKMYYRVLQGFTRIEIQKDTGDFRLVDKKVVDVINSLPEHNKFLRGLFSWVGFEQYEYEYERKERYAGKTKYPLKKMLKLASDGIIGFSTKPIKVIGGFGITFVIVSIVILLYFILSKIFGWTNMVKGWTSIMFATTFVGGIVLLSLWIIGEYLVRIYDEAKQRPQYIIKKKINI